MSDMVDKSTIPRLGHPKLMIADESPSLLNLSEIESMPIENRAAPQDEAHGLHVMERKVFDGLQPLPSARGCRGSARAALGGVEYISQVPEFVEVASPGVGRRSDRVPKNMPSVRPRTVS